MSGPGHRVEVVDYDPAWPELFAREARDLATTLGTHHLHLVPAASSLFRDRLRFRDMLRADPDLAARYGELKRSLALRHAHDREAYTDAKTPFIAEVLARGAG